MNTNKNSRQNILPPFFRLLAAVSLLAMMAVRAPGQAPSVQYLSSNNVFGELFSIDEQTNIYVNAGGRIVKLNASGAVLQSNTICPVAALTQRDVAGNYYFFGSYSPPRDFGGTTLTNGYLFIAKYAPEGALHWARVVGPNFAQSVGITDFRLDSGGTSYLSYTIALSGSSKYSARESYDASSSNIWAHNSGLGSRPTLARYGITATNGYVLNFDNPFVNYSITLLSQNSSGDLTPWSNSGQPMTGNNSGQAARPIVNRLGEVYSVEGSLLTKRSSAGTVLWTSDVGDSISYTICEDQFDGVHVADSTGLLHRFDYDGNLVWTLRVGTSVVKRMVVDAQGNRFLSTFAAELYRLGGENLSSPGITTQPQGGTFFSGSNVVLSVTATGSGPLRYYWLQDGALVAYGVNASLSLPHAAPAQSGTYTVIVSNFLSSVTSAPAVVRIKAVEIFNGSQMLTNGTYSYITPPTLTVASTFTNGSRYYTLDGFTPSFASTYYTGPFTVSNSATVRAIGYSADFNQSEEADPVSILLPPSYSLSATTLGGGTVSLNPAGGTYSTGTVVTATATPAAGWSFLYWTGDIFTGANPVSVLMDHSKSIQAVFGTMLSTTAAGGGSVSPSGGVYAYGSIVRVTGIPQPGNYFGAWGNAASGNLNPLYFTVTSANPTVSSIFAAVPAGQAALTVVINGPGTVTKNPSGNLFATNQFVTLTATPYPGQGFINWSGDSSGTVNPLTVDMTQSRLIYANFTNWPVLVATRQSLTAQGFQFTLLSGTGLTYQVQGSSNFGTWVNLGVVTNNSGETSFTDPAGTNLPARFYRAIAWP